MTKVNTEKESKLTFDIAREYFEYDPTSPSGLRWKKLNEYDRRGSIGDIAGSKAVQKSGHIYYQVRINNINYLAHRIVWLLNKGRWPKSDMVIDHIVGLDAGGTNAIDNLREVPQAVNRRGHRIKPVKGYLKNGSGWRVRMRHPETKKMTHIKQCNTEEEALKYVQAALTVWKALYPDHY